jgi:hypothetical protein
VPSQPKKNVDTELQMLRVVFQVLPSRTRTFPRFFGHERRHSLIGICFRTDALSALAITSLFLHPLYQSPQTLFLQLIEYPLVSPLQLETSLDRLHHHGINL